MTEDLRKEILEMHQEGYGVNEIARELSIYSNTVRWVLNRGALLERERKKRKDKGSMDYRCGKCGTPGHNARSCGVPR